MSNPVLLNNIDHHDLRIVLDRGPDYGDLVNQTIVFPTEFEALQREYAIIFRRDPAGAYRSAVLLGLDGDENLYVEGAAWSARYIPALMQRGPFSIGVPRAGEDGEPMIHIDPDHPRISKTEGERVFRDHGGNTPYLDHVGAVLRTIYAGNEASAPMFAAFAALDLIERVTLDIKLDDHRRYTVPDAFTISGERLERLAGADLEVLHRAGFLRHAIWAVSSLGNISRLIDSKNRRHDAL